MSLTASSAPDRLTPRSLHARATRWLQDGRAACIVSVDTIRGSTPRDQDARIMGKVVAVLRSVR